MNKTVLIIDYDERIRRIIKLQLGAVGYTLREAANGGEAFTVLEAEKVDAVICDIKMKDTDGFEMAGRIMARFPSMPVIMLTGFIEKEYAERADALGCYEYLNKPVKRERLRQVLAGALAG